MGKAQKVAPFCARAAGERELKLLGDVKDRDLLEPGCGGGQNAIVLAKGGARFVGLDISDEQVRFARKLAEKEGRLAIEWSRS